VQVFDQEKIEVSVLRSGKSILIARRYMPASISRWESQHPTPAEIFADAETLHCDYCGADLLNPVGGIYIVWRRPGANNAFDEVVDFRWCCKGACDRNLTAALREKFDPGVLDAWDDVEDMCNPTLFIFRVMSWFNRIHAGERWLDTPFERLRTLIVTVFPHVARHLSPAEQETVQSALRLPKYMGGIG
jgi:hypothetical protein